MSTVPALCYGCSETFMTSSRGDAESLRCRHCGSDFVEYLNDGSGFDGSAQSRVPSFDRLFASPQRTAFRGAAGGAARGGGEQRYGLLPEAGVSIRVAPNSGADYLMHELTQLLELEPGHGQTMHRLGNVRRQMGSEMERLFGQLAQYHQPTRTPASNEAVNGLRREKLRHGREALIGECCVVCHDQYKEGDNVVHLPCEHAFHEGCVMPWFEDHNTCPVCRFTLPTESPSPAPSRPQQRRTRRNQVAQESTHHHRDVTPGDHMIDSFLDMFRPATGGDVPQRQRRQTRQIRPSQQRSYDNIPLQYDVPRVEGERHLTESIRVAQNQLSSLEGRLTEHVTEHRRLQNQIAQLQDHRQSIRDQLTNAHAQSMEAVHRMEAIVHEHHHRHDHHQRQTHHSSPPSLSRWFLGMFGQRPSMGEGSYRWDNSAPFSDSSGFRR